MKVFLRIFEFWENNFYRASENYILSSWTFLSQQVQYEWDIFGILFYRRPARSVH